MSELPKRFVCALREDFRNVDYSKWERSNRTNASKTTKPKPVHWSSLHPDHKGAKASHGPNTASDRETNGSPNAIKQTQPEKSESSRGNTEDSSAASARLSRFSAASSRLSRRIKSDSGEQDSAQINTNVKKMQILMKLQRGSIEDLEKHCKVLQEMNQQVARNIEDTDRRAVSIAREFLIQHEKLGNSLTAFNRWNNWQISQAKAELKDAVEEGENHLCGLQAQLKAVKANLVNAQSELHTLKTYKDKEYPVKALQIAEMKRDLDKLKEALQDEYEDVKLLFQKEMVRLERHLHQKQQEVLLATAKKKVSHIPPVVKQMALHNHTMKKEIDMHKKEIMQLEDKNRKLLKSIRELQLSRPNISREVFRDVFPKSDKCTPNMDFHLSIQKEERLPI
ncbi:uncharacterized protein C20orf96 homolog [Pygocentrus nattereri]|uniref:Uncharacterized protein n=1 Tax=Pygocentrus nattereri TaxID=42514 RepID=A0A3B4DIG7_PYGNA|nr:uncharacterized protein C20orf96 homolog [Pygocentrus nattereri]